MKKRKKKNAGFSLVEVLICIVILSLIVIPILRAFRSSAIMNSRAHRIQAATAEAQNVIEQFNANPLSMMKTIYQDAVNQTLGYDYMESWPFSTFDVTTDLHGAPEECYRILGFYRSGYVSANGAEYDMEVILNPNSYSNHAATSDASNTNTHKLPSIENIDAVTNAVISTEINKFDGAAAVALYDNIYFTDRFDSKDITVTLSKSLANNLKVTCDVTYHKGTDSVQYTVYQSNFDCVLNAEGSDWEKGGDIYLFANAVTSGSDDIKIVNTFCTSSDPNLDVHLIRGGIAGDYNFGKVTLSNGITDTEYMNIYGAANFPSGSAALYHMDFTTNIRGVYDNLGSEIVQTSVLTAEDVKQYEQEEAATLRTYEVIVNLYETGTIASYGISGRIIGEMQSACSDALIVSITSTMGAD